MSSESKVAAPEWYQDEERYETTQKMRHLGCAQFVALITSKKGDDEEENEFWLERLRTILKTGLITNDTVVLSVIVHYMVDVDKERIESAFKLIEEEKDALMEIYESTYVEAATCILDCYLRSSRPGIAFDQMRHALVLLERATHAHMCSHLIDKGFEGDAINKGIYEQEE